MSRYAMDLVAVLRIFTADVGVRYPVPAPAFRRGQHNYMFRHISDRPQVPNLSSEHIDEEMFIT